MSGIDHCAEAERLRAELTKIATGSKPASVRDGEDEVRFGQANIGELRRLIAHHEDECRRATGDRRRSRYGIVGRARPY